MARVFISYEHDGEFEFISGIRGMLANTNINVHFYDESVKEEINSKNASYVKQKINEKIKRSSVLLCIIGKDTHSSEWVRWEIEKAWSLNKKIIFMRRKDDFNSGMPKYLIKKSSFSIKNWDVDFLKKL